MKNINIGHWTTATYGDFTFVGRPFSFKDLKTLDLKKAAVRESVL